jgi:protein-tyrosine-phosphatase
MGAPAVRRRLRARALAAWRADPAPLLVCYGNINRSPFAAQLARVRTGRRVDSSGLYRASGRSAPPASVACARVHGADLSRHSSTVLDLRAAERGPGGRALFVFDLENVARIAWRRPSALRRVHLFGALSQRGQLIVLDPHGRGQEALEAAFGRIAEIIYGLAEDGGDGA